LFALSGLGKLASMLSQQLEHRGYAEKLKARPVGFRSRSL